MVRGRHGKEQPGDRFTSSCPTTASSAPACRSAGASSSTTVAPRSCAGLAGPPGAPTLLLLHGWVAERGPQLVPDVRAAARALQHRGPRPARPRARPAHPQDLPARRLRRRLRGDAGSARHRTRSSRLAIRWAARSRSCCGAATATSSTDSCCARRPLDFAPNRFTRNLYQATMLERDRDWRASRGRHGCCTPVPMVQHASVDDAHVGRGRDAPPRLAHDRRGRPFDQHLQRDALDRRGRRSDRDRVHHAKTAALRRPCSSRPRQAIPGATVHSVADGHLACATARFAEPLVAACLDVASRQH